MSWASCWGVLFAVDGLGKQTRDKVKSTFAVSRVPQPNTEYAAKHNYVAIEEFLEGVPRNFSAPMESGKQQRLLAIVPCGDVVSFLL